LGEITILDVIPDSNRFKLIGHEIWIKPKIQEADKLIPLNLVLVLESFVFVFFHNSPPASQSYGCPVFKKHRNSKPALNTKNP